MRLVIIYCRKPERKVIYLHSERFVADMVRALQNNAINEFKTITARSTHY